MTHYALQTRTLSEGTEAWSTQAEFLLRVAAEQHQKERYAAFAGDEVRIVRKVDLPPT